MSNEQLDNCADVYVINSTDYLLTNNKLKSLQIQSVSIIDVLNCFPDRDKTNIVNSFDYGRKNKMNNGGRNFFII